MSQLNKSVCRLFKCIDCGYLFDPRESLMGDEGLCQLCWEKQCDRSWWEYMRQLDSVLGPVWDA